ncbi:UDP-glucuronic acid decarboxylase [Skeletonema marinoi]|uniref:UDP-glucuronate decarboxylase n=1 Tax=Skeletonema marinoi TaxID=267567 RepID=A0AAD8XSU0_9STRA|nr:UDP-glucuronic acid decarboxylase [Skeletonema marinoi]
MVVLPRHRRRFRNPYGDGSSEGHYGPHSQRGQPYQPHQPSSTTRSMILLIAGMGIGYLILPVLMVKDISPRSQTIGLNDVVQNLERQRAAAAAAYPQANGMTDQLYGKDATQQLSPLNLVQNSRRDVAAAMLRGDTSMNVGDNMNYNHRRASSDVDVDAGEEDSAEDVAEEGDHDTSVVGGQLPLPVNMHHTFTEKEDKEVEEEEISLNDAEKRFIETQQLIASQSIPTPTQPHVMKTPTLPDAKRKKILVTGGAGFVGSHLVDKLMQQGHEVIVMDNFFTGQRKNIDHWMHHPRFSLIVHDVTEPIMLEVDEIYHLACPASPPHYQYNPVKTIKTSTMGTINMLGLAKRVKAKILLTSTSEIYGDPQVHPQPESYWGNVNTIGPRACYDEGKRVAETMMYSYKNQNGVDVRVARIFNTFGPRMHPNDGRVVSNFIIQSLQDKPLTIYGEGQQTRSFQYVSDLVNGLNALMNGNYDMPVNLGNPDEYTVKNFAEHIKEMTGSKSEITFLKATKDDPTQRKPDISTAKRELDWEPVVQVKEGLQKTIAYFSRVLEESGEIIPTGQDASKPKPKVEDEA